MRVNIYIDGFNLFYCSVKGTPYKWLNVYRLCSNLLPNDEINRIRYFTARVTKTERDPNKPLRQQIYIRALETIDCLTVHYGRFLSHNVERKLANPSPGGPQTALVVRTEEKGSDVNLASYLLVDGYEGDYECAVVVSNDSDLVEPIRLVRQRLNLDVGILCPQADKRKVARNLMKTATFYKPIRTSVLRASQFPPIMMDVHGTIHKPPGW